jgi:pseudaminic acid biosynthesis-associated methylase
MKYKTEQEKFWANQFGIDYIKRNNSKPILNSKINMWKKILNATNNVNSVIEFGCNIGLNLVALKKLCPEIKLTGYEINEEAARNAEKFNVGKINKISILEKINFDKADLCFTACVLIHINPKYLRNVYENLVNSSNKYVLVAEYYNPVPITIKYRGYENRLFKRDFAGDLIENYNLKLIDYGFIYKRDNIAPQDDITWFLLEK